MSDKHDRPLTSPPQRGLPPPGFAWIAPGPPKYTPAEAVARLLKLRKGRPLPPGMTIKDLIEEGRD